MILYRHEPMSVIRLTIYCAETFFNTTLNFLDVLKKQQINLHPIGANVYQSHCPNRIFNRLKLTRHPEQSEGSPGMKPG